MATVQQLLRRGANLTGESARRDAEILLCHCLDKPRSWLYTWPEREVDEANSQRYDDLLSRRHSGEPVAYLTGFREFWSLQLRVNRHTLIPRPETETLVEWALELPLPEGSRALDLGTGSGAIALALVAERPHWQVTAVDSSGDALEVARDNARRLGYSDSDSDNDSDNGSNLRLLQSDWYAAVAGERFNLLVSNPPYVAEGDPHLSRGDLRFEPASALIAAAEGLHDIRQLVHAAPSQLLPGGWLLLEHGFEQGSKVRALLQSSGFTQVATRCDLAGRERISGGRMDAD